MEATNSYQEVLNNKAEILHYHLVTDQKSWVLTIQTRSSLGFGGLDLGSAQNIFHMNSKTELVLQVKEKQNSTVL